MITCTDCGRDRSDDALSDGERTVPCDCGSTGLSFITTTFEDDDVGDSTSSSIPFVGPWTWDPSKIQPGLQRDCEVCQVPHVVFEEV